MLFSGIVVGLMGGKSDWKIVVVKDSRCFGLCGCCSSPSFGGWVLKLFMTSKGAARYSLPPVLGLFILLCTSLHKLYFSTLKCSVGPLGVKASRQFVLPFSLRLKSSRCVTPSGPAMDV